jgi:hypothetical protein
MLLLPGIALSATRDFPISWEHSIETVDGEALDSNGDGVPDLLDGYRIFTADGAFVQLVPATQDNATLRLNVPWGETCFKLTAFMVVDGTEYQSDFSNVGACQEIRPGNPRAPKVN